MKVIFLDIDGVIKEDKQSAPFLDESLRLLRELTEKSGAVLVMSSSWKTKYAAFIENGFQTDIADISALHSALSAHGLSVYGCTPLLNIEKSRRRPEEIKAYLNASDDIESFCILDDRAGFEWGELSENLVLTFLGTNEDGEKIAHLAPEHMVRAIEILK